MIQASGRNCGFESQHFWCNGFYWFSNAFPTADAHTTGIAIETIQPNRITSRQMNAALNCPLRIEFIHMNNGSEMWYLYSIIYSEWRLYHFYWEFRISLAFDDCFVTNCYAVQKQWIEEREREWKKHWRWWNKRKAFICWMQFNNCQFI